MPNDRNSLVLIWDFVIGGYLLLGAWYLVLLLTRDRSCCPSDKNLTSKRLIFDPWVQIPIEKVYYQITESIADGY
jgi:hypothetical protein